VNRWSWFFSLDSLHERIPLPPEYRVAISVVNAQLHAAAVWFGCVGTVPRIGKIHVVVAQQQARKRSPCLPWIPSPLKSKRWNGDRAKADGYQDTLACEISLDLRWTS
jgi:hypothetical protein